MSGWKCESPIIKKIKAINIAVFVTVINAAKMLIPNDNKINGVLFFLQATIIDAGRKYASCPIIGMLYFALVSNISSPVISSMLPYNI